jgi:HEAT repeat protein
MEPAAVDARRVARMEPAAVDARCVARMGVPAAVVALVAACAGAPPAPVAAPPASAKLAPPKPGDPFVRGAGYLAAVAAQLQSRWADFLEDCRMRLPAGHPLNDRALVATVELVIAPDGALVAHPAVSASGNGDFDTAVSDVLADAQPLPAPPAELLSDDDRVHVRWQFARDRRQAGAATARVVMVELPLPAAVDGLIARGELGRAARRVATAPGDRAAVAERVMAAALREAIAGPDGAARRAALDACARARVASLADAVRGQLAQTSDPDLRLAAITAAGALGDRAAAPALLGALREDLGQHARTAGARVAALVAIDQAAAAADAVRGALDAGPNPTALAALALVPIPALAPRLASWAARGDAATRGAVCAALPAAAPATARALILRGLRDADATVRATCADAAARTAPRTDAAPRPDPARTDAAPRPDPARTDAAPRLDPARTDAAPRLDAPRTDAASRPDAPRTDAAPRPDPARTDAAPRLDPARTDAAPRLDAPGTDAAPRPDPARTDAAPRPDPARTDAAPRPDPRRADAAPRLDPPRVDAAPRTDAAPRADAALVARLHELARDRDRAVRAAAVGALGQLDPAHPVRAAGDPAPEVRAAFARAAGLEDLRALAGDRDPQVRAAAIAALGERAGELALRAASDPAPGVRRAAVAALADPAALARLARDDAPDVATAALIRATALRGREPSTAPLLDQLAAAPAASAERARIALAWLLAR